MTRPSKADDPRRSLAGDYIEQALTALHASGDPGSLWPHWARDRAAEDPDAELGFGWINAELARRRHSRTAILFAALSAEAYINEFLARHLVGRDLAAVDRLPTVDKYVVGTRLVLGEVVFDRAHEPAQTIAMLFKVRDKLVHPKPGFGPHLNPLDAVQERETMFTPDAAGRYIAFVAAATTVLGRQRGSKLDMTADVIWFGRNVIFEYAARATRALPRATAEPEPSLWSQITSRLTSGAQRSEEDNPGGPTTSA
jgi:hypothetical protein